MKLNQLTKSSKTFKVTTATIENKIWGHDEIMNMGNANNMFKVVLGIWPIPCLSFYATHYCNISSIYG